MGVVKSDETLPVFCVERQRIIETMRFLGSRFDFGDCETDPVLSEWVDDDYLSIEIEQNVEAFVTPLMFHGARLSVGDNHCQVPASQCGPFSLTGPPKARTRPASGTNPTVDSHGL